MTQQDGAAPAGSIAASEADTAGAGLPETDNGLAGTDTSVVAGEPAGSNGASRATVDATPQPAPAATPGTVTCSVIIPVHNRSSLTRQCLNALLARQDERIEREIVVVDDGSTDLTARLLAAYGDRVRVVTHPSAVGFAGACNAGAAVATGEYLVFLHNDTLPQPTWLRALVHHAEAQPRAAVVGAKLLYPDDTVQHAGIVIGLDRYPHHLYAGFPAHHPAVDKSRRFKAVSAACCLVRRGPWEEVGGFDVGFGDGGADVDLCLRLGEAGHEVHYCHDSVVYHLQSPDDLPPSRERDRRDRYAERWRDRVEPDDLGYYAADGLITAGYESRYPIRLSVSPLLAGLTVGEVERSADRLLAERARQVAVLLRTNIMLNARVQEAELRAQAAELRAQEAAQHAAPAPAGNGQAAPTQPQRSLATVAAGGSTGIAHPIIGRVERPAGHGEIVAQDILVLSGWTLSKAGIWAIEAFVDGAPRGEVEYGLPRPDVATIHRDYPDGENCGFLGKVPMDGLEDGEHGVMIRVTAKDGQQAEITARFEYDSTAKVSGRILARCDRPSARDRTVVRDRLNVVGWALSPVGVRGVETFVDGNPTGAVAYGVLRPDVALSHPDYPNAEHSGFAGSIPVEGLADGEHALTVRVISFDGRHADVETRFEVDSTATARGEVPHINVQYPAWLRKRAPTEADLARARDEAAALTDRPTISLILPVGDATPGLIEATVEGVRGQTYDRWEVLLATGDDSSDASRELLRALTAADARIKFLPPVPRATASVVINGAVDAAAGEFLATLAPGDALSPLALFEVARLLNEAPATDVVYVDEDKIDAETGERWDPFFKPDWSPDLLLSTNYLGPFTLYRRSLVQGLEGARAGFDGGEAYDLALRATEASDRIRHIPRLLYSRHVASAANPDGAQLESAQRALGEALRRRKLRAELEPGITPGRWRVRYALREQPGVTIVLPTGGKLQFLRPCLDDLLRRTAYPDLRILVVDNSEGTEVEALCRDLAADHPALRREPFSLKPFNFSAIINHAVPLVETPYVVLLNDDITVITPDWVEAMLEHAQRPEVGVVGAKLLYPDDTIQHAGVILGPYEGTGHAFKQFSGDHRGYFGLPNVIRNYSAVTFACAMLRRSVFHEIGGLDAENLPIAFNDVDACLRIQERGYRIVYTPHAVLHHHESVTKKVIAAPSEVAHLRTRWEHVIAHDPFYNPNLTRKAEDCSLNMD